MAQTPPFRADHVGSILRTKPLKDARAKREKGEISAGRAQRGRRPRDREDHQEAGGDRAQARHRRRIPPRLLALRFLQHARRRRALRARPRHPVPGRAVQAAKHPRHRQDRLHRPPDGRALQVPEGAHQGDAEDDDPVAERDAFPARAERGEPAMPIRIATPSSTISRSAYQKAVQRLLRRRLPLPAIRRHRLGLSLLAGGVEEGARARPRRRSSAGRATRAASTRRWRPSPPT